MADATAHELKFRRASSSRSYQALPTKIRSEVIRGAVGAFKDNMDRAAELSRLPEHLVRLIPVYARLFRSAWLNVIGEKAEVIDEEARVKVLTEVTRPIQDASRNPEFENAWYQLFCEEFLQMLQEANSRRQLEGILASMIQGAWTAFEVLAADLWENCLNARPRLGFIALGAEPEQEDDEATLERKRKIKYALPVGMLRKWDYDLKNRMGTLLQGKWDFARRNEAAEAYLKVFGKSDERLKQIFEDEQLGWLAATRNVIVHNAAIADAEFVKLVKRHPVWGGLKEAERVPLDGELTRMLFDAAGGRGEELALFVDDWLLRNSE